MDNYQYILFIFLKTFFYTPHPHGL